MRKADCIVLSALVVVVLALSLSPVDAAKGHLKNRIAFDIDAESVVAHSAEDNSAAAVPRPNLARRKRIPTCAGGETACRGFCADLLQSDIHCGACGNVCTSSETCCGGVCTDVTSTANCGACGNTCAANGSCVNGLCTSGSGESLRRSLGGWKHAPPPPPTTY